MQNVFCCAAIWQWMMQNQTLVVEIVFFGCVGVSHHKRHLCDEVQALSKHVAEFDVVWIFVVGVKRKHDALQFIHEVVAWDAQENVFFKIIREDSALLQRFGEPVEFLAIWQRAEDQKINDFFKTEAIFTFKALNKIGNRNAAIHELAFAWNFFAVFNGVAAYFRNTGDANEYAGSVGVTQAAFDVILCI